jgi:3-hydroxyisobutyrate dehydrogenase
MICVLGTGLLGTGFTRALLRKGESVHVWNRSPAKAKALEADGARAFASPADAIQGAARIHTVLSDDAAVEAVLAAAAVPAGALVVDHSTTSTAGARDRTERWAAAGVTYVHAPVFMGPQNAAESTGIMLMSGDRTVVERVRPLLEPLTGKVVDLGPRTDAAAAFKLLGNLFLMAFTAGCAEVLGLAKAMNVPPEEAAALFEHFNPAALIGARFRRMIDGAFDQPSWELTMARKDARLVQAEVDRAGVALALLPAIAARMDAVIAEGHGDADWTVIAKDYLPPRS